VQRKPLKYTAEAAWDEAPDNAASDEVAAECAASNGIRIPSMVEAVEWCELHCRREDGKGFIHSK
jgi:hypothetical protein